MENVSISSRSYIKSRALYTQALGRKGWIRDAICDATKPFRGLTKGRSEDVKLVH
jgi:hypothetical protein